MESSFVTTATTKTLSLFTISKALNRHILNIRYPPTLHHQCLLSRPLSSSISNKTLSTSSSFLALRRRSRLCPMLLQHIRCRVNCLSSSAASFGSGGGDVGGGHGGGGGGDDGRPDGGDSKSKLGGGGGEGGEEVSAFSADVIILDVGGMTCGGCAASVKRILESQPQVSTASVNLTTETAIVWPVSEAKVIPNWQQQLGEALAKHLTSCGFESNLRVAGQGAIEGDFSP